MNAEQKKRLEELAFNRYPDGLFSHSEAYRIVFEEGYKAGLNDPEVLGGLLIETIAVLEAITSRYEQFGDKEQSKQGVSLGIYTIVKKNLEKLRAFKERGQK